MSATEGFLILRVFDERKANEPDVLVEQAEGYRWAKVEEIRELGGREWLPRLEELREAIELAVEIAEGDRLVNDPTA